MRLRAVRFVTLFLWQNFLFAGEYTNVFKLTIADAVGESESNDPVESFNDAIKNGMKKAIAQGEVTLKGYSMAQDNVLSEVWIRKSAHLQVIDLQVNSHRFYRSKQGTLLTEVKMDVTMEYLDVPRFVYDYEKTVQGAAFRSMAIPGWGQLYNNQYTTSILYGTAFWTFYVLFIDAMRSARTAQDRENAFWNFQLPAIIFWSFNVSEAASSRFLGKQGLENLRRAYRFEPVFEYQPMTERGVKIDFIFFQIALSKIWG
ncbi:MAG: DUF5683 domain-containing protein [Leptospiraceae bacterium]|nr:DUF5683 domain-containing protein [Leptospiraceae bacterium]MDW8307201.1 DUF5683 domain-containing protein [Leptospiraceae bacterium]